MSYRRRGISVVDIIVGIALMLVIFIALFGVLRASLALSSLAKAKSAAIELANTQIEFMRGLAYDVVGTVNGIPAGTIAQTATSTIDGIPYTIHTYVEYRDDPADGLGASDANTVTTDYKTGKVTVSYTLHGLIKSVVLVSNFVPAGIESSTGGGTLSLHVVNAAGGDVSGANVHIVNASTFPSIDLSTFTDTNGLVLIGGVATSSQYEIYVSRAGYSSAQTYPRISPNVNPTPGFLTVVKDQTTGSTFSIDVLSSLLLASFSPAVTTTFTDTFASTANLPVRTNTHVDDGTVVIDDDLFFGSARSLSIAPDYLLGWGILSANSSVPLDTSVVVRLTDSSGVPLPDATLPGNSAGFSSFPVLLTGVATTSYPGLMLETILTRAATSSNPALLDWSLSYTTGLTPLPNSAFTLSGAKTIGTDVDGLPIYKTIVNDTTGASAQVTKTLESDAYTLALGGGSLIESCPTFPYALTPGTASSTALVIGALSAHTLPLLVVNNGGSPVVHATVILEKSGYAATVPTSLCGIAFFNGLASDTYSATVSATGYATTVFPGVVVAGHTATTTLTLP